MATRTAEDFSRDIVTALWKAPKDYTGDDHLPAMLEIVKAAMAYAAEDQKAKDLAMALAVSIKYRRAAQKTKETAMAGSFEFSRADEQLMAAGIASEVAAAIREGLA